MTSQSSKILHDPWASAPRIDRCCGSWKSGVAGGFRVADKPRGDWTDELDSGPNNTFMEVRPDEEKEA
jgi:hypothetical protein